MHKCFLEKGMIKTVKFINCRCIEMKITPSALPFQNGPYRAVNRKRWSPTKNARRELALTRNPDVKNLSTFYRTFCNQSTNDPPKGPLISSPIFNENNNTRRENFATVTIVHAYVD